MGVRTLKGEGRASCILPLKACLNGKGLTTKHHQTLFGGQAFHPLVTLFGAV